MLLLDEPTNHLDIVAIDWLENHLKDFQGALLFITHDRSFLQSLATRIIELDRGQLTSWSCDYNTFLERKAHALEVEAEHNARFDRKLSREEAWVRQGIKARRTRNEGRVRALKALRNERTRRREVQGKASFSLEQSDSSGRLVMEARNVSLAFDHHKVIENLSLRVMRGDKVGLIGANGAGKSTLLRILLGQMAPQSGKVKTGTRLEVAYFDQMRNQLDLEKTVIDNVAEGRETITINGSNRHVIGYLGDFLFPPGRCRVPVKALSGGERNRLLLARLFSKPANLLVMDEPTNDLDVETLELLESLLVDFAGTVLLVSHDRAFLDNVVSSTLVFQPGGKVYEYAGGFDDWLRQGGAIDQLVAEPMAKKEEKSAPGAETKPAGTRPAKKKLSYKLQRELDGLPAEIEALEEQLVALEEKVADPGFYQGNQAEVQTTLKQLEDINAVIEEKMERWEEWTICNDLNRAFLQEIKKTGERELRFSGALYYGNAALSGFAVIFMFRGKLHFLLMAVRGNSTVSASGSRGTGSRWLLATFPCTTLRIGNSCSLRLLTSLRIWQYPGGSGYGLGLK